MNKRQLAGRLARVSKKTRAAAADELDRVVHDILKSLREGKAVDLPGLGVLKPDLVNGIEVVRAERSDEKQ
ncbi:MAG: HU family DNA-binding protein [Bryobacter sp.]|jgi:nucleoid DNA-binding protein|nr:HU family DNA-binding protein [Bryobacter sp.]